MRYKPRRFYAWNSDLAYVVGLITADGCLSKDARHVDFTSKDRQLIEVYRRLVKPDAAIGLKQSGSGAPSFRVQVSDVALYDFLLSVGLLPQKSFVLKQLLVPDDCFADFVRGCFDGDGCIYAVTDKRWKNSFMFYTTFASASPIFLDWLQITLSRLLPGAKGHIRKGGPTVYQLTYAKAASYKLFDFMYYDNSVPKLTRKYDRYLEIFAQNPYPIGS